MSTCIVKNPATGEVVDEIRYYLSDYERFDEFTEETIDFSLIKNRLFSEDILKNDK